MEGRIVDIAPDVWAPDLPVLDVQGATVIPGLMNMHVHFHFAPGQAQRGDSHEMLRDLNRKHLRAYLASGVTTVLDAATQVSVAREIRGLLAEGVPGPTVLTLGPAFTAPGGYAESDWQGVSTVEEVEQRLDVAQSLGAVGIKVMVEQGFTPFGSSWPLHSAEILDAIASGARRRRLPIYVHATSEEEYRIAADMGAHAIMHAPLSFLRGGTLSDSLIERLKDLKEQRFRLISGMTNEQFNVVIEADRIRGVEHIPFGGLILEMLDHEVHHRGQLSTYLRVYAETHQSAAR